MQSNDSSWVVISHGIVYHTVQEWILTLESVSETIEGSMRQGKESPVSDNFSHHNINLKGKTSNPSSYVLGFGGNLENFRK